MADRQTLSGAEKAALFLMVMGEEFTTNVFKHLDEKEVKAIGEEMTRIKNINPKLISSVLNEFIGAINGNNMLGGSGGRFFERTVSKAFTPNKADTLLNKVESGNNAAFFEKLESLSPEMLVNFISSEHPQTIALILSNIDNDLAAKVLKLLPENIQSDVIIRIARLDTVPNDIIVEIQKILADQVSSVGEAGTKRSGGPEAAAEILNQVDRQTERSILEKIEEDEEELAEEIRQSMFIFEDLIQLDDRSIRALLKEVGNDELLLAMKTASESLKDRIFGNLSQRAAEMLKEDMEVMGPVKLVEVEQAQQMIIKTVRRLEEEGKIVVGGKGGDDIVV
ncbi:MAG: flagellar motor switch protein FliG [Thermoplasmata archaeon]|nr:MAG: flagellar motor switch protein FliG [Deltaproteobacteria bacterium]RLF57438.1 MAG: flagellar motor switch protein FliG [Thermoplasmata archaeon]